MKPPLFLLHFSGGNKYSYQFLKEHLEPHFELHPLELPGRGARIAEPFLTDLNQAADDLVEQILQDLDRRPFYLYGHSLGATTGLLATQRLEARGRPPRHLIVSGNPGPCPEAKERHRYYNGLSEAGFIEALREMGGLPDELLANRELLDFILPILRADFRLFTDAPTTYPPIQTPIDVIMGDREQLVGMIDNWRHLTTGTFRSTVLEGHHFFIYERVAELSAAILTTLSLREVY
ncbi:MAG: alpha/beta fold hydrolase [Bacteroidota bacterium]